MRDHAKIFQRAVELSQPPKEDFIELGQCIARLREEPGEFRRFLKTSGMGARKAYYLVSISEVFGPLGLPKQRLKKIGWTKLQVLGEEIEKQRQAGEPVSSPQARDLLKLAETSTTQQLKGHLRDQESQEKTHCVQMYFSPEQYRQFEEAVLTHGGKRSGRGLQNKAEAVISIIQQAQQSRRARSGNVRTLPHVRKRSRRRSG